MRYIFGPCQCLKTPWILEFGLSFCETPGPNKQVSLADVECPRCKRSINFVLLRLFTSHWLSHWPLLTTAEGLDSNQKVTVISNTSWWHSCVRCKYLSMWGMQIQKHLDKGQSYCSTKSVPLGCHFPSSGWAPIKKDICAQESVAIRQHFLYKSVPLDRVLLYLEAVH